MPRRTSGRRVISCLLKSAIKISNLTPISRASFALSLPNSARVMGDRVMEKRLQEAQLYKEKGNQRYREGKYRDAVSRYHRALLQLRGLDPSLPSPIPNLGPQGPALTPEQENTLHTIQTDCYNNLAGKKNRAKGWGEYPGRHMKISEHGKKHWCVFLLSSS